MSSTAESSTRLRLSLKEFNRSHPIIHFEIPDYSNGINLFEVDTDINQDYDNSIQEMGNFKKYFIEDEEEKEILYYCLYKIENMLTLEQKKYYIYYTKKIIENSLL